MPDISKYVVAKSGYTPGFQLRPSVQGSELKPRRACGRSGCWRGPHANATSTLLIRWKQSSTSCILEHCDHQYFTVPSASGHRRLTACDEQTSAQALKHTTLPCSFSCKSRIRSCSACRAGLAASHAEESKEQRTATLQDHVFVCLWDPRRVDSSECS